MIRPRPTAAAVALCTLLAVSGCSHLHVDDGVGAIPPGEPEYRTSLQIQFLGVGGFLIRHGSEAVMTAPLYSHPSVAELDTRQGFLEPNVSKIRQWHPDIRDAKAIFVGHAHYDHLLDVPWAWERSPQAIIYGNETMANVLSGYTVNASEKDVPKIPSDHIRPLNVAGESVVDYRMCAQREGPVELAAARVGAQRADGRWIRIPDSRVRFRALCSEHAPQIFRLIHLWPGVAPRPRFATPTNSRDYPQGETLAYLIDFLGPDGDRVEFRVYYQDAPTPPTLAQVPPEILREKRVDVALLCVGNFFDVDDPTHIVRNLGPRYVMLGHWESFFEGPRRNPKEIPFSNVHQVVEVVRAAAPPGTEIYLPNVLSVFRFEPEVNPRASR